MSATANAGCASTKHSAIFPDLHNKHVFITGGGSGIGAALTRGFFTQGAKVSFVQRSPAQDFITTLMQKNDSEMLVREHPYMAAFSLHKPMFFQCDITNIDKLHQAMSESEKHFGPIDVLVNNAGNDVRHSLFSLTKEQWDDNLAINLRPYFFSAQYVASSMCQRATQHTTPTQQHKGSIINYSSASYLMGNAGYPAYVAANAAITGLTRALARELGPSNIRVNAIVPGWVLTQKQKRTWATPQDLESHLSKQCLKQHLYAEDMVGGTLFLASMASSMMTGQVLVIDGGVVVSG